MMELGDFVRDVLVQLVNGVVQAQGIVAEQGARIASLSPLPEPQQGSAASLIEIMSRLPTQLVKFDVAVAVTQEPAQKAKIGVIAMGMRAADIENSRKGHQSEQSSRVRFSVPLAFPAPR
jgi:hypothetical protein